ncbi:hypothetical protein RRG08_050531 [Elysia crispata]|uniref:Uncharacterized protein n=1 Tax=Elysia crispata TaxID=231223 RepID=A0AAE1DM16_9GAST|nr:hypothetical protein RRG08_050531 [Elysia crispata]
MGLTLSQVQTTRYQVDEGGSHLVAGSNHTVQTTRYQVDEGGSHLVAGSNHAVSGRRGWVSPCRRFTPRGIRLQPVFTYTAHARDTLSGRDSRVRHWVVVTHLEQNQRAISESGGQTSPARHSVSSANLILQWADVCPELRPNIGQTIFTLSFLVCTAAKYTVWFVNYCWAFP